MSKVWFITGCSKGLGRVLTEELLKTTDFLVVATARQLKSLEDLETLYPERLLALSLDVTDLSSIEQAVEQARARWGRIDVLVNNAGYGVGGALEECARQDILRCFQTNVFGLMDVTRAVLPIMREQQSGCILNISSVAGLVSQPGGGIYNSTKFAVEGFSEALALDVSNFGIKVVIIEPGPFRTDFTGGSILISPQHPAYKGSLAAGFRTYVDTVHGKQPGDPVKAAHIMIQLAEMPQPPLRMLLGKIALDRFHAKTLAHAAEVAQYEALAKSADYDA